MLHTFWQYSYVFTSYNLHVLLTYVCLFYLNHINEQNAALEKKNRVWQLNNGIAEQKTMFSFFLSTRKRNAHSRTTKHQWMKFVLKTDMFSRPRTWLSKNGRYSERAAAFRKCFRNGLNIDLTGRTLQNYFSQSFWLV